MENKKIREYLFIAYEMYVKEFSKDYLDHGLTGMDLYLELQDFERWLDEEGISL